MKTIFIGLLLTAFGLNLACAQPPGTDVMITLTGSGSEWDTFTYQDGRVDAANNQVSVNMSLHPGVPLFAGAFFSSISTDFSGSINLQVNASYNQNGFSDNDDLQNQLNYNEPGVPADISFFGPQVVGANPGDLASLVLNLPTGFIQNPEPWQIVYDGTNKTLTVSIVLPAPFTLDDDTCTIPCTAVVQNNGSSFSGTVEDASTGAAIPNATVVIGGQTINTDSTGQFSVPYIAPGPLTIAISAPNYDSYQNTEPLEPFSAVSVTFKLKPAASQLNVLDANPIFLSAIVLPQQPIAPTLWQTLAADSKTRTSAAADGFTQLLLQYTNSVAGSVIFGLTGDGTLTAVDGTELPAIGAQTVAAGGQQMAFALYKVPDQIAYPGDSVYFSASFAPSDGSAIQQSSAKITLVQTPVLLVHGLWADSSTWLPMQAILTGQQIPSQRLNYYNNALYASGPFAAYRGLVNQSIQNILGGLRGGGTAVTCADVVAHSMGGILTRIDANDRGSYRIDNYNHGYVRRLITVDTPHYGSSAAPVLSLLAADNPIFATTLSISKHPVTDGGVADLSPSGFAASVGGLNGAACKALAVPSLAVVGEATQDADFSPPLKLLYKIAALVENFLFPAQSAALTSLLCGSLFDVTSTPTQEASSLFFGRFNDGVVSAPSQIGGSARSSQFAGVDHLSAPQNTMIQNTILAALQGPASNLAPQGFPAVSQASLSGELCSASPGPNIRRARRPGPSPSPQTPTPLITLIAPSNGAVVFPGSNINAIAQPLSNVALQFVEFFASGNNPEYMESVASDIITNAPFTDAITAPTNFFGPMTITAIAVDNQGNYDIEQCVVQVLPSADLTLESISVGINSVATNLVFSQLGVSQPLDVTGMYSDGLPRDIALAGAGTVYNSSDPSVAIVDTNGNVSAVGNGSAQITVMNGGLSAQVPVQVALQPPQLISIQPDNILPGSSNITVSIVGNNLGASSNIVFLLDGQPDTNLTVQALQIGGNAANIQATLSASSNATPGLLTAVVTTPVGNSGTTMTQGNRFFIGQPIVLSNVGFTNSAAETAFGFTVTGTAGSSFIVQASTNLADWVSETTNSPVSGTFNFLDTNPPVAAKYYRVQISP